MSILIEIIQGPLTPQAASMTPGCGAVVSFTGWVRPLEEDRDLEALHYEIYEPMTTQVLQQLCEQFMQDFPLQAIHVRHSVGTVAVNECSFELIMSSPHRKEALTAMDGWIDQMKKTVPIWKVPQFAGEAASPTIQETPHA